MEYRIKKIYKELYTGIKTKNELASKLDVNVKTIDNTISKYPEDIILDKNLGAYRFTSLLPSKIPNSSLFELFQDSIENHPGPYTIRDAVGKRHHHHDWWRHRPG